MTSDTVKQGKQHPPETPDKTLLGRIMLVTEGLSEVQFVFLMLVLGLFILGNFQGHADEALLLLVAILGFTGFSTMVLNGYSVLVIIIWSFRNRRFKPFYFFRSLLRLVFGTAFAVFGSILQLILNPGSVP